MAATLPSLSRWETRGARLRRRVRAVVTECFLLMLAGLFLWVALALVPVQWTAAWLMGIVTLAAAFLAGAYANESCRRDRAMERDA